MTVDLIRQYCLSKQCASEDFPFDEDTLVFKVLGKMFALVPLEKWESGQPSINLKCDPEYAIELRDNYQSIYAGYHMNKKHWNTVSLQTSELKPEFVLKLIDHSYEMVVKGMSKKMRTQLT